MSNLSLTRQPLFSRTPLTSIPLLFLRYPDADPGWGIAAWTITDWFSDYYADDVFDVGWYPHMKQYMEHWIRITAATPDGILFVFGAPLFSTTPL